jgi:DNA-directed RNA polymerase subunit M/transcription elongation factor TFIIS
MVADHAVVKDHIPPNALITDNHQLRGFICACESLLQPIDQDADAKDPVVLYCQTCGSQYDISRFNYQQINNPIAEKTPVQKVIRQSFKPEAPCIKVLNEIVKPLKQKNQQKSVP